MRFRRLLGFYPNRIQWYQEALVHRSTGIRSQQGRRINNERLEFLGDAILGAVITDIIFKRYPNRQEGYLTNLRSKIVQRDALNHLAVELGVDKLIRRAGQPIHHNSYTSGNTLEALIGAIYLDQGYARCRQFIERRIVDRYIDLERLSHRETNHKSKLIEWAQKHKLQLDFTLLNQYTDGSSSPIFETEIQIEGIRIGKAKGFSKKESQQKAARIAFKAIKRTNIVRDILVRQEQNSERLSDLTETDAHTSTLHD
ncbi:MAG: ribonuclease III [Prevotellaceae bacterium]|nr:ribonuclease III [Prevotellaceae bacterium]